MNKKTGKMTMDEAIKHSKDVAQRTKCKKCSNQHVQLAEWLEELKSLKGNLKK